MTLPEELLRNPHFSRYYRTWQKNELSIVFVPLAQICREQGFLNEAREICQKGLGHHPDSVSGRLMLARIYFDLEQLNEAKRLVEEVLGELPAQQEAQHLLEKIARCGGLSPAAPEPLLKKASLWDNRTMAQIYADQGEKKIALEILRKILSRNPRDEQALELQERLSQ